MASPRLTDWVAEEKGSECKLENQVVTDLALGVGVDPR